MKIILLFQGRSKPQHFYFPSHYWLLHRMDMTQLSHVPMYISSTASGPISYTDTCYVFLHFWAGCNMPQYIILLNSLAQGDRQLVV